MQNVIVAFFKLILHSVGHNVIDYYATKLI